MGSCGTMLFGMSTIFVEATLVQKYRERNKDGQLVVGLQMIILKCTKSRISKCTKMYIFLI